MGSSASRTVTLNLLTDISSSQKNLDALSGHVEKTAERSSGAFKGLLGVANQSGAFGPLMEQIEGVSSMIDGIKEHGADVGKAMVAGGFGLAGIGGLLTKMAQPEMQAEAQLKQAISNVGQSYEEFEKKIGKVQKSNEHFGFGTVETYDALRTLTQATGDTNKAIGYMGVAVDLAASKHVSLTAAASMLAKAYAGSPKLLKEFGVSAVKAADNTKELAKMQREAASADKALADAKENLVMLQERQAAKTKLTIADHQALQKAQEKVTEATDKASAANTALANTQSIVITKTQAGAENIGKLAARIDGQGAAAADTLQGKMKAMAVTIEDTAGKLGAKFGPAITGVGTAIGIVGGLTDLWTGHQERAAAAAGVLTTATEAEAVAMDTAAVSEGLALGPILLIIAAVALVGIAIYELATHWDTVWAWIKDVAKGAWHWISDHAILIGAAFGPLGLIIALFAKNWDKIWNGIKSVVGDVWHWLEPKIKMIGDAIGKIGGAVGKVGGAVGKVGNFLGFEEGGRVPGDIGAPMLAIVHGGEYVVSNAMQAQPARIMSASVGGYASGSGGRGGGGGVGDVYLDGRKVGKHLAPHVRNAQIPMGRSNPSVFSGQSVSA